MSHIITECIRTVGTEILPPSLRINTRYIQMVFSEISLIIHFSPDISTHHLCLQTTGKTHFRIITISGIRQIRNIPGSITHRSGNRIGITLGSEVRYIRRVIIGHPHLCGKSRSNHRQILLYRQIRKQCTLQNLPVSVSCLYCKRIREHLVLCPYSVTVIYRRGYHWSIIDIRKGSTARRLLILHQASHKIHARHRSRRNVRFKIRTQLQGIHLHLCRISVIQICVIKESAVARIIGKYIIAHPLVSTIKREIQVMIKSRLT